MKIIKSLFKTMLLSTTMLASQSFAAASFDPEIQPLGYIGPIELSNSNLSSGAKAYRGWFENGSWQGDLIEYNVSSAGAMSTSIDLSGTSPAQTAGGTNWSAHVSFADNEIGSATYWSTGRKIITSTNGTNQVAFRWPNLTLTQKGLVDPSTPTGDASSSILDYLRGDRSNEAPNALRPRFTVLGDIIHSNPEYVGAPEGDFSESSYVTFKNANASRAPRVYVGANDGMLHAFNANNGNEVWAYVPSMVMHKLSKLAGAPYAHTYFVDGGITVQDAFFGGDWHTVLVGSMGAGARGLFALDVTSPTMTSESIGAGSDKKILWELDDSDNDVGYIFDATTITRLNDGNFYAINGNGVSSANGVAKLFLVNIATGAKIVISTGAGSAGSPNGLAAPALLDSNNDGKADYAFAGDIDGDMWKFDLSGATSGSWKLAYKLYDGKATQPITMSPDIANHPQGGHLVLFGTGRLYTDNDIKDTAVQALYGIWDKGTAPGGAETRLAQLLSADTDYIDPVGGVFSATVRTFTTTAAIDYSVYSGWVVDLPAGERLLTQPQLRAGRLKTTISDPDGFENWLLEVTFDEGGVADEPIFDLNRSGTRNSDDNVDGNGDGDTQDAKDIPMAWRRQDGAISQVTIASLRAGVDTLFLNFLNPPLVPPACEGDCTGGIAGGHIDVDSDSAKFSGLGGSTDEHQHEYDDEHDRTYVDYFDIDPENVGKPLAVDEVGIDPDEKFIVLIANADLSKGAKITINTKTYWAVEYQRIIQEALAKWNGNVNTLKDPTGYPLVHSINSIAADGGTLRNSFDNRAIIGGGLHPTQTSCVKGKLQIDNGRWRNGALTMQVIKASEFAAINPGDALDKLTVQAPTDMPSDYKVVTTDGTPFILAKDTNNDGDSDDGAAPDYEIYGGLHTSLTNADPFLYESTLFWHFGKISDAVLGIKPCYGDEPDYTAAYKLEVSEGTTQAQFDELVIAAGFEDADGNADFEALEEAYLAFVEAGNEKAAKKLKYIYNHGKLRESIESGGGGGGSPGGGGGVSGTPIVIEGGISEGGETSGPNFDTGRRTWIDIMPE